MDRIMPEYSIVIPVYNSGPWLDELIMRIGEVMRQEAPDRFEVILVNDCSPDAVTWMSIQHNAKKYSWVRGFNLLYNVGQFKAIMCGMEKARGQFVITMDDDLQHPPEEIPKLIHAINSDENVLCIMARYESKQHSLLKNAGSLLFQKMITLIYGKPHKIQTTSFRILRKELVEVLLAYRTTKPQISPLIVSITHKIKNVTVRHEPRKNGNSGYSLKKLMTTALDNVINSSTFPLRVCSLTGFLSAGGSVILALYYATRWLLNEIGVPGYTSQILLISFFGGMTLAGIGVLGEYIARIIAEITGPEIYRIKESTD